MDIATQSATIIQIPLITQGLTWTGAFVWGFIALVGLITVLKGIFKAFKPVKRIK